MARRALDAYETPEHYVRQLLATVAVQGKVFEPCVGDGAIARFFPDCVTNDLDSAKPATWHMDARLPIVWREASQPDPVEWTITNPPFKDAAAILEHALATSINVAMVLRISFFEPTKERETLLTTWPPQGIIYLPRYSFTQNGKSDMATCLWAIWSQDLVVQRALAELPIRVAPRFA